MIINRGTRGGIIMGKDTAGAEAAIAGADRIELLDALRGLALFGILLANIPVFFGWLMLDPQQMAAISGPRVPGLYDELIKFFIDGKFYTIFSLLFGIGFTLQLDRLEKRGAAGVAVFRRRMLILLCIGFVHMCLIWQGDILTLYAALGLLLPFFRGFPERKVLIAALILLVLPLALEPLRAAAGIDLGGPFSRIGDAIYGAITGTPDDSAATAMQRTDMAGFLGWQLSGLPFRIEHLLVTWRLPKVMGVMLLGMVAGRRLMAGTLLNDKALLWRTLVIGLIIGVPCNLYFASDPKVYQEHWSSVIGTVPLGLAYAAAFALAWPGAQRVLGLLAPVGRMALTNYLTHSVLGVLLLGPFLGLATHVGPVLFTGIALALYLAQILFSRWWLAHHDQGPMERMWRWGTYGARARR